MNTIEIDLSSRKNKHCRLRTLFFKFPWEKKMIILILEVDWILKYLFLLINCILDFIIYWNFDFIFRKAMFPQFLQLSERKVLDSNGPLISMSQTKIRNVCLSIIFEFCQLLWSVGCSQSIPAHIKAWNIN